MTDFVLLALATFVTWETLRAVLPFRLPAWSHSPVVVALAYAWTLVPYTWLLLAAVAASVGLLHSGMGFGDTDDRKPPPRLPRRRSKANRVPDLP